MRFKSLKGSPEGKIPRGQYLLAVINIVIIVSCHIKTYSSGYFQQVIAEHLSVEEVAGIKEGFDKMDTSNKGKINIDELRVGLHKLGHQIPDTDLQILMEAVSSYQNSLFPLSLFEYIEVILRLHSLIQGDINKDGYLDCGEFVAISVHLKKMGDDEVHLKKAFDFFDLNQSGFIEIEELRVTLADEIEGNCEEVINAIINDVDTDKVSNISSFNISFFWSVE